MASNAMRAQGVVLKRGNDDSPLTYSSVGEITSFDGPGGSASEIDVTSLESTAKEFLIGLPDEGEFAIEANLVPGNTAQAGLRADRAAGTLQYFQLLLTDSGPTTLSFTAYVKEFKIKGGVDDKISVAITLRITGPVSWA